MTAARDSILAPIPVLLYHRVAASADDRFAVDPATFAKHLDAIVARGHTPLTIGELADGLRRSRRLPPRPLAITIDDGYADTPAAVAALADRGLRATVYVTAGSLEGPGGLTVAQLGELAAARNTVELGAHTVTHRYLDSISVAEMQHEISSSKRMLEDLVGAQIATFAYPHGAYDAAVRETVIRAGFRSAAAVKNAFSHREDDPWAIARYTVTAADGAEQIVAILEGRGAPLAWREDRLRTRAARVARKARCRAGRARGWTTNVNRIQAS